jgi:hypothetical protein
MDGTHMAGPDSDLIVTAYERQEGRREKGKP